MGLPSNRVTRGRVVVLTLITMVALAFGVLRWGRVDRPLPGDTEAATAPVVGTASSTVGSTSDGNVVRSRSAIDPTAPASPDAISAAAAQDLLPCLRTNESRGEYTAVSPSGDFFGAYQFDQQTWDNTAQHAGRLDLVGTRPSQALPVAQDQLALALLEWQGTSPWHGDPCVA
jgi:hypothetical protein